MSRVSFDENALQNRVLPNRRVQRSNSLPDLRQPRPVGKHNVDPPLANRPQLPQHQYREFLRYEKKDVDRVVLQEAIDRATQKGVSRGAKQIAKREVEHVASRPEPQPLFGRPPVPKQVGTPRATSTLEKLSLQRDPAGVLLTCADAVGTALRDLEQYQQFAHNALARHMSLSPQEDARRNQLHIEVPRRLLQVKSFANKALKLLDAQIDQLEWLDRNGKATLEDLHFLSQAKKDRKKIESCLRWELDFFRNPTTILFAKTDEAIRCIRPLSRRLNKMVAPFKQLETKEKRNEYVAPSLKYLTNRKDTKFTKALDKAASPIVQSLDPNDKQRVEASERLNDLSKPLMHAKRGGLISLTGKTGLSLGRHWDRYSWIGGYVKRQGLLDKRQQAALKAHADRVDEPLEYAKEIIAESWRRGEAEQNPLDFQAFSRNNANFELLPQKNEDAESYDARLRNTLKDTTRQSFYRSFHVQLRERLAAQSEDHVQPSERECLTQREQLRRQYDDQFKLRSYAKVIHAAYKAEIDVSDLNALILPAKREDGVDILPDASQYGDDLESFAKRIKENIGPDEQVALFRAVDEKLKAWTKEYRSLRKQLRPQSSWRKVWTNITSIFRKKPASEGKRAAGMVGAFADEFSISVEEADEANKELHHASEEHAENADLDHASTEQTNPEHTAPEHTSTERATIEHTGSHEAATGPVHQPDHMAPSHEAAEKMPTGIFTAKTALHSLAIWNNINIAKAAAEERGHLLHKMKHAEEELNAYKAELEQMTAVASYRSRVRQALYEKTGDQSILACTLEEMAAYMQVARHTSTIVHDALAKAGVVAHVAKVFGQAGFAGAAIAEFGEGLLYGEQALTAGTIKTRLRSRRLQIDKEIADWKGKPDTKEKQQQLAALKLQKENIEDLSGQQDLILKTLSSLKGLGMGSAFTLLLVGTLTGGVGAAVLLAIWAGTQSGLSGFKWYKGNCENKKLGEAEDMILGRSEQNGFHQTDYFEKLMEEAENDKKNPTQVALRWISRGKDANSKRPNARKMLASLKLETKAVRADDEWIVEHQKQIAEKEQHISDHEKELEHSIMLGHQKMCRQLIDQYRQEIRKLRQQYCQKLYDASPTARTLCDAYRMKPSEIAAIVDAPNDDLNDELGVRLISEYHNSLQK